MNTNATAEHRRLVDAREQKVPWRKWGPYLSERQWGTVREDYSDNGSAWDYFTHDQARSRAYRWGEDGIAGISDEKQRLCFALALWNARDAILKERLFGLTNSEGNHGEDVKEYYFYLDSTPTHSYMKYLYKYPQCAYPYEDLVKTNRARTREQLEYELLDTGVFNEDRYFDVFVEYAKADPDDILIRIHAVNRGPEAAQLHLLPTLWFRNTWWMNDTELRPHIHGLASEAGMSIAAASHATLGVYHLYAEGAPELLFTENETNNARVFGRPNESPFVKDGVNDCVVSGRREAVNSALTGTKLSAWYRTEVAAGASHVVRLRLTKAGASRFAVAEDAFGRGFDALFDTRRDEADEFYGAVIPESLSADQRNVMRQALAGMLWGKQYYFFDLDRWLGQHSAHPLHGGRHASRNRQWFHMLNDDVISMPDKWEYPWYAAWDLAFHTLPLNLVDPDFAREQLALMLSEVYLHPNGQIPAYEWNFGDVNPPVHAFATLYTYNIGKLLHGQGDIDFLKDAFRKLLLNFNWWVNRKDPGGRNVFEGGFLGLDNIGVFDRSSPLPTGGRLEQADGTAWMALYCQNMLEMALELASHDATYEDMALRFIEHFFFIAAAMDRVGEQRDDLWDEEDGFFYDVLRLPDGSATRIKVRSMVGLLPLCAAFTVPADVLTRHPGLAERIEARLGRYADLLINIHDPRRPGHDGRHLFSILNEEKLRRVLARMLDEERFLSDHGIRSLSRHHLEHPYVFDVHGEKYTVQYLPAESNTGMFGGNSNWRGPIWFPVNLLILRALLFYYTYFGDDFRIECPTGSGRLMTLYEAAMEIAGRLTGIFLADGQGRRPVYGATEKFQSDPHWRDLILFYEYFHGDNGAGLGASHQTGWTGVVALLLKEIGTLTPERARAGQWRQAAAELRGVRPDSAAP